MRDLIVLNEEQMDKIRDKVENVAYLNPVIALPSFDLQYVHEHGYIVSFDYDDVSRELKCTLYYDFGEKPQFTIYVKAEPCGDNNVDITLLEDGKNVVSEKWKKHLSKLVYEDEDGNKGYVFQTLFVVFLGINKYMAFYNTDELFNIEEKIAKKSTKKSSGNKAKHNSVRMYRCYTLKKDWQNAKRLKRPHKIECGAWGVRGHYRHYKSGQVVFIKAYVKGKNKDKYQGKEYKLFGGGKAV